MCILEKKLPYCCQFQATTDLYARVLDLSELAAGHSLVWWKFRVWHMKNKDLHSKGL